MIAVGSKHTHDGVDIYHPLPKTLWVIKFLSASKALNSQFKSFVPEIGVEIHSFYARSGCHMHRY